MGPRSSIGGSAKFGSPSPITVSENLDCHSDLSRQEVWQRTTNTRRHVVAFKEEEQLTAPRRSLLLD